jgi:UDP-N-acetylmuramoyl-tripeptide--D-alanyl-D-alanine ligase
LRALQDLALHHRKQLNIPILAITGSNGKTTTKELIHAALSTQLNTQYTKGNLNNHIGVPLTLLSITQEHEIAIVEMGANHQKEIASYCAYTLPTHVLINNCGKAHLEGFGGIDGVRKGKGELYDYAVANDTLIFRNTRLEYLTTMAQERNISNEKMITYGGVDAQYKGVQVQDGDLLNVAIMNSGMETTIHTQLFGDYNFDNVMAAVAVASYFGLPIDKIRNGIESYTPDNSRSQLIKKDTNTIILDAYNANGSSMQVAIENFAATAHHQKVLMLGSMKELGAESDSEHQAIIDLILKGKYTHVVLVGPEFNRLTHPFLRFETSGEAQQWFQSHEWRDTAFLIKGSRGSKMEVCVEGYLT